MFANTPSLIFQCHNQTIDHRSSHRGHSRHRIVPHVHNGIVKQDDERFHGFRPPDLGYGTACMGSDSPILISTGADQRLQRGGIGEFGERLGGLFTGCVVDILECC